MGMERGEQDHTTNLSVSPRPSSRSAEFGKMVLFSLENQERDLFYPSHGCFAQIVVWLFSNYLD